MSGTLLNPRHTAAYDPASDRVVIAFRDGRDASVVEFDPDAVPAVISALMAARRDSKAVRKAVPLPPPMVRPASCPPITKPLAVPEASAAPADRRPVRLLGGPRR